MVSAETSVSNQRKNSVYPQNHYICDVRNAGFIDKVENLMLLSFSSLTFDHFQMFFFLLWMTQ